MVALTSHVLRPQGRATAAVGIEPAARASASPMRQPVASIQSTRSQRSSSRRARRGRQQRPACAVSSRRQRARRLRPTRSAPTSPGPGWSARRRPRRRARTCRTGRAGGLGRAGPAALPDSAQRASDDTGRHFLDPQLAERGFDVFSTIVRYRRAVVMDQSCERRAMRRPDRYTRVDAVMAPPDAGVWRSPVRPSARVRPRRLGPLFDDQPDAAVEVAELGARLDLAGAVLMKRILPKVPSGSGGRPMRCHLRHPYWMTKR